MIPGVQSQDQKDKQIRMLGLRIDNLTMSEALDWIMNRIQSRAHGAQISFINAHCANVARKHSKYRGILASSDLVLADGIGMKVAGDLLEKPIVENVNGTDMFPLLCSQLDKCSGRVYLLGGGPGVADKVASWISSHYPDIRIVGARSGFFSERQNQLEVAAIKRARPDVLLVAMGVPARNYGLPRTWRHREHELELASADCLIFTPVAFLALRNGFEKLDWNGCTACTKSLAGCGSVI